MKRNMEPDRGRRHAALLGPAVVLATLAAACGSKPEPGGAPDAGGRAVQVTIAQVTPRDVPITVDGLGSVTAYYTVTVKTQVDGRLDQVLFKEGQEVRKGQQLAQIDPRPFTIQLHQAEGALARDRAQLDEAKRNLQRYDELTHQKLIAQQQADDQKAAVGQAEGLVRIDEAAVESAQLNLVYSRILAPIDGITGIRQVDPGNVIHVADQTGLVLITQLDPIAVIFTLPEDDLPRVLEAQRQAPLTVEAFNRDGTKKLGAGQVALVDNQINVTTATVKLKAVLPNPQRLLWPNQFVKARLLLDVRKGALTVPSTAVRRGPQGSFVYVVNEDKSVAQRPVQVEPVGDDLVIVDKGLNAGESIVVDGQNQLRPGAHVEPRPANRPVAERGRSGP